MRSFAACNYERIIEGTGALLRYHRGQEVQDMKYLKIFTDFIEVVEPLSDGALGRLFRTMLRTARSSP